MLSIHPACALWPRPSDEVVREIAEDIKARGLDNPIWLFEGAILDGKTRYEACEMVGVTPRFETYTGNDPVEFVVSQNAKRRHMSQGAMGLIIADLAKLRRGGDRGNQYTGGKVVATTLANKNQTMTNLAEIAGLSRDTLIDCKTLHKKAEPNVIEMVRANQVGIQSAASFAKNTPRTEQRIATPEIVRKSGYKFRNGSRTKKNEESTITIPLKDMIDKFLPLIKRVKEQSKRHTGTVSLTELGFIAHELKQLADSWMKGESET